MKISIRTRSPRRPARWDAALVACAAVAVLASGCKKGEADASGASAEPAACNYHHPSPKFCMTLPAGYEAQKEQANGSWYTDLEIKKGADSFLVEWAQKPDVTRDDMEARSFRENETASGTVFHDDGKGGYWYDDVKKGGWGGPNATYHSIGANVKLATGRVKCIANGISDEAKAKEALAACKSLRAE